MLSCVYQFHVWLQMPPKPEPKQCTKPEVFQLQSLVRHEEQLKKQLEEKEKKEKEEAQGRNFKAQSVMKEYIPHKQTLNLNKFIDEEILKKDSLFIVAMPGAIYQSHQEREKPSLKSSSLWCIQIIELFRGKSSIKRSFSSISLLLCLLPMPALSLLILLDPFAQEKCSIVVKNLPCLISSCLHYLASLERALSCAYTTLLVTFGLNLSGWIFLHHWAEPDGCSTEVTFNTIADKRQRIDIQETQRGAGICKDGNCLAYFAECGFVLHSPLFQCKSFLVLSYLGRRREGNEADEEDNGASCEAPSKI